MQEVVRGARIPLDAVFRDAAGDLVDPTTPLVDILDANAVVVDDAVPVRESLGHFNYPGGGYLVGLGATLGVWTARWTGTVDGDALEALEEFEVVAAPTPTAPSVPGSDTCAPWATLGDLCSPCDDYAMDTAVLETWLQVASDNLYNLTGRRWPGECERTERPCGGGCFAGLVLAPNTPASLIGALSSLPWPFLGSERRSCGCTALSRVRLSGYPVTEILEVLVDGEVVDPAEYMIQGGRYLVGLRKADGTLRTWPNCQYLELATTEEGTFSVRYLYGAAPPPGGVAAAASLGCQLALSCQPEAITSGRCRLPKRVTTITRQGVTLAVIDTFGLFKDGLTGLAEVDMWISAVRYGDKGRRASMSDPSRARGVR